MTGVEDALGIVWWVIGAAFATGGLLALLRMVKGPTIVDRMVASDTILTIIVCVLGADMVYNRHTSTLPLMLILSMTAFIASVAVARYVSRQSKRSREAAEAAEPADGQVVDGPAGAIPYDRVPTTEEVRRGRAGERAPREAELQETEALEAEVHGAEEGHRDDPSERGGRGRGRSTDPTEREDDR